jgi:hypothetical protein
MSIKTGQYPRGYGHRDLDQFGNEPQVKKRPCGASVLGPFRYGERNSSISL